MRRSAIVYCRRTPLASETFSSTRVIPEITPSTCSKRPSLAADAARSISAARRSPTVGDVLLRSRSASTSTAPGGSAARPVGVARAPGGRTASCTAAGGGPGWEGGGAGPPQGRGGGGGGAGGGGRGGAVVRTGLVGRRREQLEQLGGRRVRGQGVSPDAMKVEPLPQPRHALSLTRHVIRLDAAP